MGVFDTNYAEVRGSVCGFPTAGHKKKAKRLRDGSYKQDKNSPTGIGETYDPDICGQDTSNSGGVGGPAAYF